jgi:hypothetical protein
MSQQQLTYLKFAIVALVIVGVFLLAALGKIAADAALSSVVTITTGLVVALGISGGASALAARAAPKPPNLPQPPTGT